MSLEKKWMDANVVPLLKENNLKIHSFIWNGNPPKEVLVWLHVTHPSMMECQVETTSPEPTAWAETVKRMLEAGWRFDFTREQVLVVVDGQNIKAFGGDGAPLFSPEGKASVRLFKKTEDGVGLVAQVACTFWETPDHESPGKFAAAAVKGFFALFDTTNPMEVCAKYAVPFGAQ
jgi:hypothetical protein